MKQAIDAEQAKPLGRVKAISLWQPWAVAMQLGLKRNETRSWATSHRGDLVICSAKRKPTGPAERSILASVGLSGDDLWLGYALCVVELYQCVAVHEINVMPSGEEFQLGDYSPGRFVWRTRNLRALKEPIQVTGRQGFFSVDLTGAELTHSDEPLIDPPCVRVGEVQVSDYPWYCGYCDREVRGLAVCSRDGTACCSDECAQERDWNR